MKGMGERKYYNQSMGVPATPLTAGATWQFFSCFTTNSTTGSDTNGLKSGSTATTRVGLKVLVKRINFTVTMTPLFPGGMTDGCFCRFVVYHNKDANGAVPTGTTMFLTDTVGSNRAVEYFPKLSLVKDFGHTMVAYSAVVASTPLSVGPVKMFKFSIFPNKVIEFTADTGVIASVLNNDYGIGVCATESAACNIVCNSQVIFTDV